MTDYPARDAAVRAFQKRRAIENRRESDEAKRLRRLAAPEPPVDKGNRDPIFSELDRRIEKEVEQARQRVRRAMGAE